ncbi:hypothetical protein BC827DRAFT_1212614 [Russula dissimulans]|nr:hypothetical protein BC827DRAFT_1212614 [Russula dissimulans]
MRRPPPFSTTTLMVKPPPSLTPSDVHDSSLSELDSISDSDWLDISASEDAGSIGIPESDRDEGDERPLSRRSYSSRSSSRDGDVDIWEGLVESTDDEALEDPPEFSLDPPPSQPHYASIDGNYAEERRVEDALNQSMVSTLSTSRASSMSASGTANHPPNRPRDLRLSFPDPLSGSNDDLLRPSEELCSSPTTVDAPQLSELSDDEELSNTPMSSPSFLLKLPTVEFEIYLYGTPPERKWSIVESLLEKWGASSNYIVSKRHPQSNSTSTYWLHPKGNLHRLSLGSAVPVIDNTETQSVSNAEPVLDKQSLAIVFLPTYLPSLPSHTLFLPVIASAFHELAADGLDEHERQVYEQQWSIFKVPKNKHLFPRAATVLAEIDVNCMKTSEVAQAFEPLQPLRRKILRGIKNQVAATPALTIVAILSIVLGYVVSRFMPLPVVTSPFVEKADSTPVIKPAVNLSEHLATSFVAPMSSAISVSSVRDISVVIASTSPSSLSTVPASRRGSLMGTEELRVHNDKAMNSPAASSSKSLIISQQSPSLISEVPIRSKALAVFHQAIEQTSSVPTETASSVTTRSRTEAMYSLSTRLASSLSEMFNVKVLAGVLRADMKELLDALDELLGALSAQVASAVHVTEGLRDQLRRRNQHAQQKARALREKGERIMTSLSERARGHVARARSQARALKDAISTEVVTACKKHQERGLIRKMRDRQRGQSRKLRHGMRRVAKGRMGF